MKDLSLDEVKYLLDNCDLEMKSLKSKLVSINMERDHILRKINLIKREKDILTEIEKDLEKDIDQTHIVHPDKTCFAKFLETSENDFDNLNKSLYLRYTQTLDKSLKKE